VALQRHARLGRHVRHPGDPARGAGGEALERPVVAAHEDLEVRLDQRGDAARVARALLDRDDGVDLAPEPEQEARQQVGPAARDRVVVDHDRQVGGGRHGREEGEYLALVAAVEQRRQQHHGARSGRCGVAGVGDRGLGIGGGDAGGDRHLALGGIDERLDGAAALGGRQAAGLAHRAVADDAGQPGVEQRAGVAAQCVEIDLPAGVERGGDGGDDSGESHAAEYLALECRA
jgi:hypothetical protein